jgi:hypothetical protein
LVIKTKTNNWPDPNSIRPARLACLPLPKGAKYTAVKTAVVNIADPPEYPEEVTSYTHLWAGFAHGITVPETFVRIFGVLGRQMVHDYYLNMALGYIVYRRVAAATTHHFSQDALNGLLITLAIFRRQVPNFLRIWEEILSWPSDVAENNWMQARSFAHHPSCRPPLFGLTFVPPDMPTGPWEISTQWSERELMALILVMRPLREALQNLLHYADAFIRTWPASNPLHSASIPGYTPGQMFTASFVTADPMPGALAPPPATPNPSEPNAPADNEGDTSTSTARASQRKPSKTP